MLFKSVIPKTGEAVLKGGIEKAVLGITLSVLLTLPWFVFRDKVSEFVAIGYGGLFLICFLANMVVIIPVSSTASVIMASSMLNPALCVFIGSFAAVLGEQISYVCGRLGWRAGDMDAQLSNNRVLGWLYQHKYAVLISAAFFSSTISDVAGLIAGSCRIPWYIFTLSVWIGKLVKYGLTILMLYCVLPGLASFLGSPFRAWVDYFLNFIIYNYHQ